MKQNKDREKSLPKRWVKCEVEAEYFGDERKLGKRERKLASAKDRSKYKKTDREKFKKTEQIHKNIKLDKEQLSHGRVLSITPQGYIVESDKEIYACSLRGLLKKERSQAKNLVAVGDFVLFQKTPSKEGFILHVEPRRTVLSRADNLSRRKEQLIAVNIDQVIITTSVISPPLKPSLVDRYIIATCKGGMQPLIVVNKIDLLEDPSIGFEIREREKELYEDFLDAYKKAGEKVISISAIKGTGLEDLKKEMQNKASVFSGQSGVGKSSLINAITFENLPTGNIVDKTKKGSHTTTKAQLLPLEFGGWCIDTPGIKSFGIWDLKKEEIELYFSEIYLFGEQCKFPNCAHLTEQGCAVLEAVKQGKISPLRYDSFQLLLESVKQEHLRR